MVESKTLYGKIGPYMVESETHLLNRVVYGRQ